MITFEPIGFIRTPYQRFYDTPRQPGVEDIVDRSYIELLPGNNYEQAVQDLQGCERIWLVVHFHQALSWKPKVLPPRGRTKRGVFATRSPHRPNPIGITCCELLDVHGLRIDVLGTDLIDNTPVLDIKPYVAYADAFPESNVAWMSELESACYSVVGKALEQLPNDLRDYVVRTLQSDPMPHPYRRIELLADGVYQMAVRKYRIQYRLHDNIVSIEETRVVL